MNSSTIGSLDDINKLKIQINNYDSYQSKPTALDLYKDEVTQVPVIRIFGALQTGHHVTVHIHNAFPYLLIDYFGDLSVDAFEKNKYNLTKELEMKLHLSFQKQKKNTEEEEEGFDDQNVAGEDIPGKRKYIADVTLCKAVPFYGFHIGYKMYYKISLLSPLYKTRLSRILSEGQVFNRPLTTFEAHIPFFLQFLSDFNLYGCGWLNLSSCYWRYPLINSTHKHIATDTLKTFLDNNVTKENLLESDGFKKTTQSILEIDTSVNWIENRKELVQRDIHHNFVEKLTPEVTTKTESYISSLNHLVKDVAYQTNLRGKTMDEKVDSSLSDERTFSKTDWMAQKELDSLLQYCIKISNPQKAKTDIKTFVENPKMVDQVPTIFKLIDEFIAHLDKFLKIHDAFLFKWESFGEIWENLNPEDANNDISWFETSNGDMILKRYEKNDDADKSPVRNVTFDIDSDSDFDLRLTDVLPRGSENDAEESGQSDGNDVEGKGINEATSKNLDAQDGKSNTQKQEESEIVENEAEPNDKSFDLGIFKLTQRKRSHSQAFNYNGTPISTQNQTQSSQSKSLVNNYMQKFTIPDNMKVAEFHPPPLDRKTILNNFEVCNMLKIDYSDPFYSNPKDLTKPFVRAGKRFVVGTTHDDFIDWVGINHDGKSHKMSQAIKQSIFNSSNKIRSKAHRIKFQTWDYLIQPPSFGQVSHWIEDENRILKKRKKFSSQIETITQRNDFKYSYNSQKIQRRADAFQNLTCFGLEIHVNTRDDLNPDPQKDEVKCIFYKFDDSNGMYDDFKLLHSGVLMLSDNDPIFCEQISKMSNFIPNDPNIEIFDTELDMVERLLSLVQFFDPDILAAYELHATSWGYLIERFRWIHDIDLCIRLSRTTFKTNTKFGDRWGYTHASGIKITGRHCLNIWRLLKSELALTSYSIENVTYHTIHETLPSYTFAKLTSFYTSGEFRKVSLVLKYFFRRVELDFQIIQIQELITRNTEQARLIGIDFYSIFYRGSQYKVESILTRLAKAENLILISPTKKEVHKMRSLECIPLIMEPDSAFYKSPLVVLDFQSLYPSIVIGFNYCYSTLLGKLRGYSPKGTKVGVSKLKLPQGLLEMLEEDVIVSPNGYMFVKKSVRKSILAKMLEEILDTRIKVKNAMKLFQDDPELTKLYNSRQLALKLIANVTYGYTSATFSGRMPNSDIADAIVSTGREMLTKSIDVIEKGDWGAKVVYGDTDSLFVYLPGKTRNEAFKIGRDMADNITKLFPNPVKLKFEKVYHPCVLLSKKRYVGYSYEYEDQKEPKFDAKGIETVRRDGIPAQSKILEKSLRILFDKKDLSAVKSYVLDQFHKIMMDKVSIKDFCFAKEVRIGTYKNEKYLPPGAVVSMKKMEADGRSEPQYRERVPYIVAQGYQGERIKDKAMSPEDFLAPNSKKDLHLDHEYYITRVLIPPLERVFNLMGVDIRAWYKELPRVVRYIDPVNRINRKGGIDNLNGYVKSSSCTVCQANLTDIFTSQYLCYDCISKELKTVATLSKIIKDCEIKVKEVNDECSSCHGFNYNEVNSYKDCTNHDCLTYFNRIKAEKEYDQMNWKERPALDTLNW